MRLLAQRWGKLRLPNIQGTTYVGQSVCMFDNAGKHKRRVCCVPPNREIKTITIYHFWAAALHSNSAIAKAILKPQLKPSPDKAIKPQPKPSQAPKQLCLLHHTLDHVYDALQFVPFPLLHQIHGTDFYLIDVNYWQLSADLLLKSWTIPWLLGAALLDRM